MTATTLLAPARLLILAAGLLIAVQNARADADRPAITALREQIEVSYQARDLDGIESVRQELLTAASTGEVPRAAYYAAYARFRQGLMAQADRAQAGGLIDHCISELRDYVASHPADAEARALLGSCYGISTRYHKLAMASRGLEARKQMAAARELAPQNPWVMLQDGLADFATPRLFGGDRDLAIAKLERATALFAAAIGSGSRLASWGAAEAWLQLGEMYRDSGRAADARLALERAVTLAPQPAVGPRQMAAL